MEEVAPVRHSVTVGRPAEVAFRIFTDRLGAWWPLETHSIASDRRLGRAAVGATVEPRVGGRVYETLSDGTESDWATVLVWEPPKRFVLEWGPNPDRPARTEVEVTFSPTDEGCVVAVEHRGWERLGGEAAAAREGYDAGWPRVLSFYAAGVEDAAPVG